MRHHLLLEVAALDRSVAFYRDRVGLRIVSQRADFAMLEAGNVGVALWQQRWGWEGQRHPGERNGLGLYPHLEVADVPARIVELRAGGARIVQEPKTYDWGTEAFFADPDGYTWALVHMTK
jgi:catechol 2,3-dioxygenase-like lactoylglutathione lyase family enzyme